MTNDRSEAAAEVLTDLGWTFVDGAWKAPADRMGNTVFMVAESMAAQLEERLDLIAEDAERDVGAAAEVEDIGPMLDAWRKVRPPDRFCCSAHMLEVRAELANAQAAKQKPDRGVKLRVVPKEPPTSREG